MENDISLEAVVTSTCSVLRVSGDIDCETSPELRAAVLSFFRGSTEGKMVLDLSRVGRFDSSGAASLLECWQEARHRSGRLILSGLTASARRVLDLARLRAVFETARSVTDALVALKDQRIVGSPSFSFNP